ncbi:MAG TPA: redoxin domain-containing protein [Longimicrobium sp.]
MMPMMHPNLADLADYSAGDLSNERRDSIAAHLPGCTQCHESLEFVRGLAVESSAPAAGPTPDYLLARILASRVESRHAVVRPIPAARPRLHFARWAAAGAAAAVLAGLAIRSSELSAAERESVLEISPARPERGDTLRIRYTPTAGTFTGFQSLVLRARIRTPQGTDRDDGVPALPVATLRRNRDGVFAGTFVFPDSVVYAALAVEDSTAVRVDDRGGRPWEVLVHAGDTIPTFAALRQRTNDLAGRDWEEAYATARRLARAYPGELVAWTTLASYEGWLRPATANQYRPRIAAMTAAAKGRPRLPSAEIGMILFDAWTRTWKAGATRADTAELEYWWGRILREHPGHEQIAQRIAIDVDRANRERPRVVLDSLERAYPALRASGRPIHSNFLLTGEMAAEAAGDDAAYRRWMERKHAGTPDSARALALALASRPSLRAEGIEALRRILARPDTESVRPRALEEDAREYRWMLLDERQRANAVLGRALLAAGDRRGGLEALERAAAVGWHAGVLRDVAAAHAALGHGNEAAAAGARLVVDPRTPAAERDSLLAAGAARLGAEAWSRTVTSAREEMIRRTLERSTPRAIRGRVRLAAADGRTRELRELTAGRPAVVVFWSRHCGPARRAARAIDSIAGVLRRDGTPVVLVLNETLSPEVQKELRDLGLTLPAFSEVEGSATQAFVNSATPSYYVLDELGRIRFSSAPDLKTVLLQVAVLRGDDPASRNTRVAQRP